MTLEEKKKLVAEKVMGWKITTPINSPTIFVMNDKGNYIKMFLWNPQSDPRCWPEIWEKMYQIDRIDYLDDLIGLLRPGLDKYNVDSDLFLIHTAKPEICFEALVKTLEEG